MHGVHQFRMHDLVLFFSCVCNLSCCLEMIEKVNKKVKQKIGYKSP